MKRISVALALLFLGSSAARGDADKPLLLQKPTLSRTHVAFIFAGDLWIVGRQGGEARRLTTGAGRASDPIFSPDGSLIAFSGNYDGNRDVYVIPAAGGEPRRLTYHPGPDGAVGWTPDGKRVLFWSLRNSYSRFFRLFTIPVEGGFPTEVPLPEAIDGSYSPDGKRLAYVPLPPAFQTWKRYRGGRATPIWIADLASSHIEKVPRENSNDFNPMWIGDHVYFLSDRNGPVTLFSYDVPAKQVTQVLANNGLDLKSASAGPDAIVYEQFGGLHLFHPQQGEARRLDVRIPAELPGVRPHFEKVAKQIRNPGLSPSGMRAVVEVHGEILTIPAEKGDIRNLTNTTGIAERDPAWSPDGKSIAYFSDESGEYDLHIRSQNGDGEVKKIKPGNAPSFYYSPTWSPDGKKIAYTDKRLNLWYVALDTGISTRVDTNLYDNRTYDPAWSPDSRWLTYTRQLKNYFNAVFVYDVQQGKSHQITDGMSDARFPVFDKNGKYLYFTASTDAGAALGWEMSILNRPVTRSAYVVVLGKDQPSPLAPESDEEKAEVPAADAKKQKDKEKEEKPAQVRIGLEDIDQRILALPIPAHNYLGMLAGKTGVLFLLEGPTVTLELDAAALPVTMHHFDLEKRKVDKVVEGVTEVRISHNGEKLLYHQGEHWVIKPAGAPSSGGPPPDGGKSGDNVLKTDDLTVWVDPRAEWRQMYREVWRIERDFLYDPGFHGLDLKAAARKYAPYLDGLASRNDLNYLFSEMLGELTLGHVYVFNGPGPETKQPRGGLLGADYTIDNGRYRFARVYRGENWNPQLRSPLTQPGVQVKQGEYLLAVNGHDVRPPANIYSFFEGTAGKSVVLKVGPQADGAGARQVTVVPIENEAALRNLTWIDENRRKVDRMTNGRVAYIYLPDTWQGGFTHFNRYFFSQLGKEGAVLDERFNGGGLIADYIIDYLRRPILNYWTSREGNDTSTPFASIYGPKAMIVNEYAGSGGDAMPWYFRKMGIGPLIGKRTWGGLVGIDDYPPLIDGGAVTAPRSAFYNLEGAWEVENYGVAPDIEVELDPEAVRAGHDPQLEKAVAVVMEELKKNPLPRHHKPPYPNYHKVQGARPKTGGDGAAPGRR
jgi:tricorn protease